MDFLFRYLITHVRVDLLGQELHMWVHLGQELAYDDKLSTITMSYCHYSSAVTKHRAEVGSIQYLELFIELSERIVLFTYLF